jgi:glyoxylase-like metal-dependent hydrolase (beta-lactamase superfamily II)
MSSPLYTITPLDLGGVHREKSFFTYMTDVGRQIELRVISFLLRSDNGDVVLVDTGGPAPAYALPNHLPYEQSDEQGLVAQLALHELAPEDVDAVVYTHLHWDHAYNGELLPRARFFVTRRELEFARDPCPVQDRMYDAPAVGGAPPWLEIDFAYSDVDPAPLPAGLSVVPTPGHSPGHQSVVVPTRAGTMIVAGDIAPLYENWERRIPNGMLHNLEECFASFARLDKVGGTLLASHDPRTLAAGALPRPEPRP